MNVNYEIITVFQCYDYLDLLDFPSDTYTEEDYQQERIDEQNEKLEELGYEKDYTAYSIHFFDSPYSDDVTVNATIEDAIQMLAIKDGVDLVRYETGNVGFVAYYNGCENGFEILGDAEDEE